MRAPSPPLPAARGGAGRGHLKKKKKNNGKLTGSPGCASRRGYVQRGVMTSPRKLPDPLPLRARLHTHTEPHTHTRPGGRSAHACGLPAPALPSPLPQRAARQGRGRAPLLAGGRCAAVIAARGSRRAGGGPGPAGRSGRAQSTGRKCLPQAGERFPKRPYFLQKAGCQRGCRPPGAASPHLRQAAQRARERDVGASVAWRCLSHRKWKTRSSAAGAVQRRWPCQ